VSRACKIVNLVRSQYYYSSKKDDSEVIESLQDLAFRHPSYGFRKLFAYLRRAGKPWNHKRVHRIYQVLKLNKRRKGKRRLPDRIRQPLAQPAQVNEIWSVDFMSDSMIGNRKFRTAPAARIQCDRRLLPGSSGHRSGHFTFFKTNYPNPKSAQRKQRLPKGDPIG